MEILMSKKEQSCLLLSINDATRSIGVCRATFYELLNQGLIESVKIGARRLVVQKSLNTYVESLQGLSGGQSNDLY